MWLLFLFAGIVVALIVRWWIRSNNNPSLNETSLHQHTMIEGGHYLRGLPGVDRSYYFIKFLPTAEGFDLYSTVEGKFEKFTTLLKSEIDSITIADKSFSVKKFNPAMMPVLGVAGAVAFKKNKNYDVAIMTVIIIKDSLPHEGIFSFEQQDSEDESAALANKTMEQLISHLKSIEN
jgi:hypothetical protein